MKNSWENPDIKSLGKRSILISWEEVISEDLLYFILYFKNNIIKKEYKSILYITNTYNSLLISYKNTINNIYSYKEALIEMISSTKMPKQTTTKIYTLPVCYDKKFGLDLEEVSHQKSLTKQEIIDLHSSAVYTIYFIGFLPGFLYLGGLDNRLQISRKKGPRLKVKKGAVGLAENQTGIYPQSSPGGWQIIGNCPITFFKPSQNPPVIFESGNKLKFQPISVEEHEEIIKNINSGTYRVPSENFKL